MTMSRRTVGTSLAIAAGTALLAGVQATPARAAADEASAAAAVEAYRKAILGKDKAALEAMTLPQLSYSHSSGVIQNQAEFIDGVMNAKAVTKSIAFSKNWNEIVGDNAISRFVWTSDSEEGGKETHTVIGVLIVWKQDSGKWKMLARQGYKI